MKLPWDFRHFAVVNSATGSLPSLITITLCVLSGAARAGPETVVAMKGEQCDGQ